MANPVDAASVDSDLQYSSMLVALGASSERTSKHGLSISFKAE